MKIRLLATVAALSSGLTGCVLDPYALNGTDWFQPSSATYWSEPAPVGVYWRESHREQRDEPRHYAEPARPAQQARATEQTRRAQEQQGDHGRRSGESEHHQGHEHHGEG